MRLIDSSSIVKYFSQEPGWEGVREYLFTPISIELSMVELGSGLLKKVRAKSMKQTTAIETLRRCSAIFRFVEQKKHLDKAFEIAEDNGLSVYDSLFIAVALRGGYELVTSDGRQAEVARKFGIKTIEC